MVAWSTSGVPVRMQGSNEGQARSDYETGRRRANPQCRNGQRKSSAVRMRRRGESSTRFGGLTKLDFAVVSANIVFEMTRLLNRIYEDSRRAADRAHRGYEVP